MYLAKGWRLWRVIAVTSCDVGRGVFLGMRLARNVADGVGFLAAVEPPYPPRFRPPMCLLYLAGVISSGPGTYGATPAQSALYLLSIVMTVMLAMKLTGASTELIVELAARKHRPLLLAST